MKSFANRFTSFASLRALFVLASLILLTGPAPALAQAGAGGRTLDIENLEETTELQVKSVARELGLDDSTAAKLTEAAIKSRKTLMDAIMKRMAEGVDDNSVLMTDVYAMQVKERQDLLDQVSGFLNDSQAQRVGQTIGSYNLQWDSYILELSKLGLDQDVREKAEARLLDFVSTYGPIRDEGYQNGDLSFVVRGMVQSKQSLDRDLKEILPKQKYALWAKKTELRFRGPDR